jgi:hypothetical protein
MFRVADEVEPQSDAVISSSNMKPVKWVKWKRLLSAKNVDELSEYQISTQTRSPFSKLSVD